MEDIGPRTITPRTLLVLGNNYRTGSILRGALEPEGHAILECSIRRAAFELAASARPDLVIVDLVHLDDGLEVVAGLHALPGCATVPIIACAASVRPGNWPFTDVLPSPVDPARLLQVVKAHLDLEASSVMHAAASPETRRAKYRSLIENIPDVLWSTDAHGKLIFSGGNVEKIMGLTHEQLFALPTATRMAFIHEADRADVETAYRALHAHGTPMDVEYRFEHQRDGRTVWLHTRARVVAGADGEREIEGLTSDITERKRLEAEFRQAQRIEAVGQLAGGVAHDFNNILAVIVANAELLVKDLDGDSRRDSAEEIREAALRGAALTRQLLAFSRQQVLEPRALDLNQVVTGMDKMLRRLIGEDIVLTTALAPDLGAVKADVGQLEQVVMNLVVNARDAMPRGGRLTLETSTQTLDERHALGHGEAKPGRYVVLAVTDSGCGMDRDTQRRIFEPFFTTKERGRGTGLGLSTCHGIVKQSGGHIWVHSEVDCGTVFKVYLPVADEKPEPIAPTQAAMDHGGSETILLIEDDAGVRRAARRILARRGYRVLEAGDAAEAEAALAAEGRAIALVVSDVVMPEVSGPEIVARLRRRRPDLKVMFMSGYTDHALLRDGTLPPDTSFLQKPFAADSLAQKVRETIDASGRPPRARAGSRSAPSVPASQPAA